MVGPVADGGSWDPIHGAVKFEVVPGVHLHGKAFDYKADEDGMRIGHYGVDKTGIEEDFHLMLCHTALLPDGQQFFGHWTTPEILVRELPLVNTPDLYVCGHIHDYLGSFGAAHVRAVNWGALSRGTIDEFNLRRTVVVGTIDISWDEVNRKWICALGEIPLKSMRPAEEIFCVDERKATRKRQDELENLALSLKRGAIEDFAVVSPEDALRAVVQSRQVRPSVLTLVDAYVDAAKRELT